MNQDDASRSRRWYVIHTKHHQELRAESNLRAYGIEVFGPHIRDAHPTRKSSTAGYRVAALFPGYLFARFDAEALFTKIRSTRGVRDIVGFGEYATPVDERVIEIITKRVGSDGFVHLSGPEPGDAVEILGGPLRSLFGVVDRYLSGRERVLILLASIGAAARVELPQTLIRKAYLTVQASR